MDNHNPIPPIPIELLAKVEHDYVKRIHEKLDEEYLLDRKIHGSNKEWTDQ